MPTTKGPAKGAVTKLKITQEGAKRFFVGLSWNPAQRVGQKIELMKGPDKDAISKITHVLLAPFEFIRVLFGASANLAVEAAAQAKYTKDEDSKGRDVKSAAYDLDLDCYIFDQSMKFLRLVGTEDAALVDPSKKVYHTGEDQGGSAGQDDEQVFVETNGLPSDYHHFYFVVKCDSKYHFAQYDSPFVRLVDSKTGDSQLECRIGPEAGNKEDRTGEGKFNYVFCRVSREGENGWKFETIDEYVDENWDFENSLPQLAAAA